jgi:hypothetical protein
VTITDATHALAAQGRRSAPSKATARGADDSVRLVDVVAAVEPTWVEAVAVVQAVCAQLKPGDAAPALDAIRISSGGAVSFEPAGSADPLATVTAIGQLLAGILRSGDCPLPVWEVSERARRAPATVGDARAFGAALTCLPPAHGPKELSQFVQAARNVAPSRNVVPARPVAPPRAAPSVKPAKLWARMGVIAAIVAGGIGAGVSMGTLVAMTGGGGSEPPRIAAVAPAF